MPDQFKAIRQLIHFGEGGYYTCANLAPRLSACVLMSIECCVYIYRRAENAAAEGRGNKRCFLLRRQVNNLSGLQPVSKRVWEGEESPFQVRSLHGCCCSYEWFMCFCGFLQDFLFPVSLFVPPPSPAQ